MNNGEKSPLWEGASHFVLADNCQDEGSSRENSCFSGKSDSSGLIGLRAV
jgi:hypothetical protein